VVLRNSEVDRLQFTWNPMLWEPPQDRFGPVSTGLWQVQVTTPQCSANHDRHHTNANGNCDKDNCDRCCTASPSAEPFFSTIQNASESASLQVRIGCPLSPIFPPSYTHSDHHFRTRMDAASPLANGS